MSAAQPPAQLPVQPDASVTVELGERSYPVLIGRGLLSAPGFVSSLVPGRDVLLVSNETVAPLYLDAARQGLAGKRVVPLVLPDGEAHKTLFTLERILDALVEGGFHRDACVAALGGGVVGDVAGFAAACYQRGVDYLQLPTTLLAQVDSSVGGKTAVNHPRGKNLIGAFHQPVAVVADTGVLETLPPREFAAGLAEVIKYGLILEADFFAWLEEAMPALQARDPQALAHAIATSCRVKARVVAADEHERGLRALLNLGHTFGHAIEALAGYGEWLHGEAVAVGMLLAAETSRRLGHLSQIDVERVRALLQAASLPTQPPPLAPEDMLAAMGMDKKVLDGKLRLVLLRSLGDAYLTANTPRELLHAVLAEAGGG